MNLTPYLPLIGQKVSITWRTKEGGVTYFDSPNTAGTVTAVRELRSGEVIADIAEMPNTVVRIERVKKQN